MEAHGQPLRGLRWAGGASLPFLRTEMPLRDIPVFRMAYFTIKPYYGLISKTLMLQVRSAHPPMPHRNVFSKHSGVPVGLFGKPKRSSSSRFAAFGGRGELRSPLHPPLPPPSGYGADSFKGSP